MSGEQVFKTSRLHSRSTRLLFSEAQKLSQVCFFFVFWLKFEYFFHIAKTDMPSHFLEISNERRENLWTPKSIRRQDNFSEMRALPPTPYILRSWLFWLFGLNVCQTEFDIATIWFESGFQLNLTSWQVHRSDTFCCTYINAVDQSQQMSPEYM